MAYSVNGENLSPRQGLGAATVLRTDLSPLRILQQGDAVRARRAAADAALKQKQAADIAKQWAEDRKLGLDTGGLFQEPFNAYTANAQEVIGKNYADEQAGRITTAERIQANANYKNEIERERLLGIDKDKLLANYETSQAAKPYRDMQGLHTALGETVLDPTTNQRVRATQYDERANLTKLDADPRTYAADPIIGDYYKGLQASTIDEATAGRIGGLHSSSSLTYKGLIPTRRADGTYDVKRDAVGRPVLAITKDELATARASNHNLNMAVGRLRYEYDNQRKTNPALPEKSDLDLFQDASQKYVSFRQADSAGRNAQPAVGRAKKSGQEPYVAPTFDNTEQRYSQPDSQPGMMPVAAEERPAALPMAGWQQPAVRVDYAVKGTPGATPVDVSTSGKVTNKHIEAFVPESFDVIGANGTRERRKNNTQPLSGYPGASHGAYVDEKTGEPLYPKTNAEGDELVRQGKARLQVQFDFNTEKNENFSRDLKATTEQLMKLRNDDDVLKYPTRELAEAAARKALTTGTVRTTQLRTPKNAPDVDRLFGPNYRLHQEALDKQTAALRASKPATVNPGGGIYKRPASTTQPTATPAPSRGGGIYKVR